MELHGGSVVAISEGPGKGSEFLIRLPLAAAAPSAVKGQGRDRPAAPLAARRILVVDDNRDAADSLAALLRLLGAEVQVVYSGADALAALEASRPSVVLMDVGMPEIDGNDVARRVRQRAGFQDVTLVALSGWGQKDDQRRTQEAGFDYHLVKPANVETLERLLLSL